MKRILNLMFSLVVLVAQILCVNGCKLKDFFDEQEIIYKENADVESNPNEGGNEEEIYEDKYLYAGLTEEEWESIVSNLINSTFKEIIFETKNPTTEGKRNKGLLAEYVNSNDNDFSNLTEYLKTEKNINYDEKGNLNGTINANYFNTKLFLGYTSKENEKRYEYSVILFLEDTKYNNKDYDKDTLLISIMLCMDSQNMTPLQHSQQWLTTKEQKEFTLNGLILPNGVLMTDIKRENTPCKYGASKIFETYIEGNEEHFEYIIKKVHDLGFRYDKLGVEHINYKDPALYEEPSIKTYKAYKDIANIGYSVNIWYSNFSGIKFTVNFYTYKKEEDMRTNWLTNEEKIEYGIQVDVDKIQPTFATQKDAEKFTLLADFAMFYFVDVKIEDYEKYCKEVIFKILGAKIDFEDENTIYTECVIRNDAMGNSEYQAIYLITAEYIYSVNVVYNIKEHSKWAGGLYSYTVEKDTMTITFRRIPVL